MSNRQGEVYDFVADWFTCRYFSSYVIANLGIQDKRTTIMINIFLLLWKACCSVGGIFLIDKIGARKPLSKCHRFDR